MCVYVRVCVCVCVCVCVAVRMEQVCGWVLVCFIVHLHIVHDVGGDEPSGLLVLSYTTEQEDCCVCSSSPLLVHVAVFVWSGPYASSEGA